MTIQALHKICTDLIAKGAGRRDVCISKDTFRHPLEPDGCKILPVEHAGLDVFEIMDGDGFAETRADGSIKTKVSLVLRGTNEEAP